MSKRKDRAAKIRKENNITEAIVRLEVPFTGEVLYHYTCAYHLSAIFSSGYLKLTSSDIIPPDGTLETEMKAKVYKPVVWLTDSKEPIGQGLEGSAADKKEIKITVAKKDYMEPWTSWKPQKKMPNWWKKAYCKKQNPSSWYVSEEIVPFTDILKIENRYDGTVYYEAGRIVA